MEAAAQKMVNRAPPARAAAAPAPVARSKPSGAQLASVTRVSSPTDAAERQAESTAKQIMRMEAPSITRFADTVGLMQERGATRAAIARRGQGQPELSPNAAAEIASSKGSGAPLPPSVSQFMEPRFGADFSGVRIHTGDRAAQLSRQVSADAFTVGNQIYFGKDKFKPDSPEGKELIAHELSHTLQQGAVLQRREEGKNGDGKRMYRTMDGKEVELPPDLTAEEAAKLERDGKAAEKRLGKGPPPKPVPDAKKLAKKGEKREKTRPQGKGRSGYAARGQALAKPAAAEAMLLKAVGGGAVARYLVAKGAPVLARGIGRLGKLRQNEQTHDDAGEKLNQSEKAVVIPASEDQAKGNTHQVDTVEGRKAPVADEKKAKGRLTESLAENVPRNIEDVDNFKRDQKAQHMGAEVVKVVQGDSNAVTSTFGDVTQTPPPAPSDHVSVDLPPTEVAPSTAAMNLGQGAVAPLQKEHTDVSNFTKEADGKLKEEGVTQEQLDMVDSGDLAEANKEKKGLETKAKTEPLAIQKFATQEAAAIDDGLQKEEKAERERLKVKRRGALGATAQKQKGTKSALEKKRDEVAAKINGIYKAAQDSVKKKLADLETLSMKRFDEGNARATKAFEDNVQRELKVYKDDRYSGWFGWARKAKDWLLGMDDLPRVKAIFETNRRTFVDTINQLVESITADQKRVIQECKKEVADAKQAIKDYVDKLGPNLKDIGKRAAGEMDDRLAELDKLVSQKEEELAAKLKDKQTAAIKAIDEKIAKMKEAMSGALAKLGKLLLLAAKKFFTWALEKFGFSLATIEGIINKGIAVLKAIFTGPIKFVKNLISAASTGFSNFGKNFLTHLKNAVFEWLTGSLEGIVLPESWTFQGIVSVIFQLVGLTYQHIRARLVKVIPEPVVKTLETTFTLVKTLVTEGPMAAWEQLKEIASDMKDSFVDAVKDWVKWQLVQKAIETVLSLFIPGAGIIRAIIGIYDTIVFFIQKAKQIMQMIGSFLGSIADIAAGNLGAAAAALEEGLARGLKLVIDFLARFLRLKGITAQIRKVIDNIHGKVEAVIDKVVAWIVAQAKKLGKLVVSGAKAVASWLGLRKTFTTTDGQRHSVYFQGGQQDLRVMMATKPDDVRTHIADRRANTVTPLTAAQAQALRDAEGTLLRIRQLTRPGGVARAETESLRPQIEGLLTTLTTQLQAGGIAVNVPLSNVTYVTVGTQKAGTVKADPLSARAGNTTGSKTGSSDPPGWAYVESSAIANPNSYVRMHLLYHRLHGPGRAWNLVPALQTINVGQVHPNVEVPLKDATDAGAVLKFSASVTYPKTGGPIDDFPNQVTMTWSVISAPQGVTVPGPPSPITLPPPTFTGGGTVAAIPDLSVSSRRILEDFLPQNLCNAIVRARANGAFRNASDFKQRVDAALQAMFSTHYQEYQTALIANVSRFRLNGTQLSVADLTWP